MKKNLDFKQIYTTILPFCFFWGLLVFPSCSRERLVDKEKLLVYDYRLYQHTPAWELAKAVDDGDEDEIIRIVKNNPALINYQEPKYGQTLLMKTILNQQMKSFKILLDLKANINIYDNYDGTSAIILACSFYNYRYDNRYAELLIKKGADVNDIEVGKRKDGSGFHLTPLIVASENGNLELVKILLKYGADLNYRDEFGGSALSQCVMQDYYNIAIYLLKNGADYQKPIFYRPSDNGENNPADDKPVYLVDALREAVFDLDSKQYKYKMEIVDFLKSKGIDYRNIPIPDYTKKKIQEEYPNNYVEYLIKY